MIQLFKNIKYKWNNLLLVELKVSTADALRGTFAITAKSVTLGVAVVQNRLSINRPFGGGGLRVWARAGEWRHWRLRTYNTNTHIVPH